MDPEIHFSYEHFKAAPLRSSVTFTWPRISRRCVRVISACESFDKPFVVHISLMDFTVYLSRRYCAMTNLDPNQSTGLFLYCVDAQLGQRSSRLSNEIHV
jgi:hypothetical protein